jgi:putative ABC transport system ATP-binding protein
MMEGTMMTEPLYELHGASKTFRAGGEIRAVDDVDLVIWPGEFAAIEGPSGSGKSTLLQLLGALDRASAGSVRFEGKELTELDDAALTNLRSEAIGFVFQSFNLIPTLTAAENVEIAMVPRMRGHAARRTRALELLEMVGLADRATHLPSKLSGGEQQRVAIARALANEPRVILADEPTGNLDTATSEDVVQTLARLSAENGVTVILVTHAEHIASRAYRRLKMRDGKLYDDVSFAADDPPPVEETWVAEDDPQPAEDSWATEDPQAIPMGFPGSSNEAEG